MIKGIGKVGYVANSPFTKATGTLGAGGIGGYVKKKFKVEVMFITSSKVICRVVDGFKKGKKVMIAVLRWIWNIQDLKLRILEMRNKCGI